MTSAPRLPRELLRQINRLAAQRAKAEAAAVWSRHKSAMVAAALDLLIAGHKPEAVLAELAEADLR